MKLDGSHSEKPTSIWCRRRALLRWTGLTNDMVRSLIEAGTIHPVRFPKRRRDGTKTMSRYYYSVEEIDQIEWTWQSRRHP